MNTTTSRIRYLTTASLLTLSLCLPLLAQVHTLPTDTSGLELVAPGSLAPPRGSFWYLSRTNNTPPSPTLSTRARAAGCQVYYLPWSTEDRPAYLVDDTALAQAEQALSELEAQYGMAAPAPAENVGDAAQGAPNMPPTGYAPCDAYKEFWFSHVQDGGGSVQLTLSNTLPGLQYVILQANNLTNASWTSNQTLSAAGYVTVSSPISVGAGATHFFRAELAANYSGPVILNPPQDTVVPQGTPVTFTVVATGNPAPGYQWEFNGGTISGATASALTVAAQPANVGTYTVIVSNVICQASASAGLGLTWTNVLDSAISASPAVSTNGTVFIATMTRFYALDPLQGAILWQTNLDNSNSADLAPSAALAPNYSAVYVASQSGSVLAFNPTNGALLWSNNLGGTIYASPAVSPADGTIYVPCDIVGIPGSLFALNPATGGINWLFQSFNPFALGLLSDASPAIGPDCTIYFVASAGDLYALHPDGSLAWFFPFPAGSAPQSSPAFDRAGNILVGSADGYLYCVSPTGGLKWLFNVGQTPTISASPAVGTDNTVYAASMDGRLFAIANGELEWQLTLTNGYGRPLQLVSSPAVTSSNVVLIGAQDSYAAQAGGLYAVTNGALMAFYPTAADVISSPAVSPADSAAIVGDLSGAVYKFPGQGRLAADAPWPAFRHNAPHSGAIPNPACAGGGIPWAFPHNPAMNSDASLFSFYLSGTPGSLWGISASTNLVDWAPIGSATLDPTYGNTLFSNAVPGITNCFYRADSGQRCSQIIGFVNQTILPGTNLIANHLFQVNNYTHPQNTAQGLTALLVSEGLPTPPDGMEIRRWNGVGFNSIVWRGPAQYWDPNGDMTLLPGQATFFINPSDAAATIPFMGLVAPGITTNPITPGASFLSSILPKAGLISTELGFSPNDGDKVLLWRTNHYSTNTWSAGAWSGTEPSLRLGEGFLLLTAQTNNWTAGSPDCSPILIVPANPLWTDTGFTVTNRDIISFPAGGLWSPGNGLLFGPAGDGSPTNDSFLASATWSSLIAFVGPDPLLDDGRTNHWGVRDGYFPRPAGTNYWDIGATGSFTNSRAGTNHLWFGINDDALTQARGDNSQFVFGRLHITHQ